MDGHESFDDFEPNDVAYVWVDPRRSRLATFRDISFTIVSANGSTIAFGNRLRVDDDVVTALPARPEIATKRLRMGTCRATVAGETLD